MPDTPVSLAHLVRLPKNPTGKSPLLVLLHGVGSNEEDLFSLAPYLDERFIIASLRAPLTIAYSAYGWYPLYMVGDQIEHDVAGAAAGRECALKAVTELVTRYDADPERVYLMGFSQGAIMSIGIALSSPETIAGAVIMSGHLLPDFAASAVAPARLDALPIFVAHGTEDNVLPVESGRMIERYLKQLPVDLTYREYPMAHTVSQESLRDIATWLTSRLNKSAN